MALCIHGLAFDTPAALKQELNEVSWSGTVGKTVRCGTMKRLHTQLLLRPSIEVTTIVNNAMSVNIQFAFSV